MIMSRVIRGPGFVLANLLVMVRVAVGADAGVPVPAAGAADTGVPVHVAAVHEGEPFDYVERPLAQAGTHRILALSYPSPVTSPVPNNNTIPAELYLPDGLKAGDPPRPAVICLHILNGNFELARMLCAVLADGGVPALMFKLPYYGERSPAGGRRVLLQNPELFAQALTQATADIRRSLDLLASRPEIDGTRIGISGISLGAIIGASACGMDERIWRGCFILGGGDVLNILGHARETRQLNSALQKLPETQKQAVLEKLGCIEPLLHAERLGQLGRAGRIMMINASDDEVIPRASTDKLAAAAQVTDQVVWLPGLGHYTAMAGLPRIIETTVAFFARDLPPGTVPAAKTAEAVPTAFETLIGFIGQLGSLLGLPPGEGKCHYADVAVSVKKGAGKEQKVNLVIIRGNGAQFSFSGDLPEVGRTALGFGEYPWLVGGNGKIFVGAAGDEGTVTPAQFLDPAAILRFRVLAGMLVGVSMAPHAFEPYVSAEEEKVADGRSVSFTLKHPGLKGNGRLVTDSSGRNPRELTFVTRGLSVGITFRQWQIQAPANSALFMEPPSSDRKEVSSTDLCRMFAAAFNFALEMAQ